MKKRKIGWTLKGLTHRLFRAQRSQKMCFGQYDNDTDPLGLCLFLGGSGVAFGESSGGTGGTDEDEDEVAFDLGSEILTLDFYFLGEDGFG